MRVTLDNAVQAAEKYKQAKQEAYSCPFIKDTTVEIDEYSQALIDSRNGLESKLSTKDPMILSKTLNGLQELNNAILHSRCNTEEGREKSHYWLTNMEKKYSVCMTCSNYIIHL